MIQPKKTYVLTVSEYFPKTHKRSGEETGFINLIALKTKKHTIRGNYELWRKRFEEIEKGKAVLSVRSWSGEPYNSKQIEYFVFDNIDGIGIQKLTLDDYLYTCNIDGNRFDVCSEFIPENDGLSIDDFEDWFKKYDFLKPMAIIHFSNFRYSK